ncbi:L-threonine dehydratase catabolic TdcB [Candidatus Calditenuaceae archaeon HR02]|nr:L-threonine dehydratase catabolic TdcB [Candidatus Calditenuaceae archaeon HR02]
MITLRTVIEASQILKRYLRPTPLIYSKGLSRELGCEVWVKLENLNPTHSFKVRGGIYYMYKMFEEVRRTGVITASMGNHAQSIAYAGSLFGVDVHVVMPSWVSDVKKEALQQLGAHVITYGNFFDEAALYAEALARERGYRYIHAINETLLYPGVATMHLEVLRGLPGVDVVFNPIGGGSGAIGACIVYKTVDPSIRVIGVQAEGAPAFYESLKQGRIVSRDKVETRAEGLAVAKAYDVPFSILRGRIDDVVLVSDGEMERAIRKLYRHVRQIAEHAGAAATAAAYKMSNSIAGKKVVLMLTGGNIDEAQVARILSEKD